MIYSNNFLCTSVAYFPRYFRILFIFLNLAFSKGAPFQPVCNWWWLRTQSCLWESYRKDVKKIFLIEKEDTDKKQEVRLPRLRAGGLGQCLRTTFCDQIFERSCGALWMGDISSQLNHGPNPKLHTPPFYFTCTFNERMCIVFSL